MRAEPGTAKFSRKLKFGVEEETLRQREELRKYHELLQQATTFAPGQTAQSALAEAQSTREQLKQQNQQMEEMRKSCSEQAP